MYYTLLIQDDRIMPDCLSRVRFWIHDGPVKICKINLNGAIIDACEGSLSNGKFEETGE